MTSGRTLLRGAFLSSAGMIVSMIGSLALSMILTRWLDQADVGVFLLFILACDTLLLLNNFGLYSSMPKLVASASPEERPRLVGGALGVQLAISAAFGGAILVAWAVVRDPAWLSDNANWLGLYPFLWMLPPFFLTATQRDTVLAALAGLNRYGPRAIALMVATIVDVGLVAVLLPGFHLGLTALMLATLASYAVALTWLYAMLPARHRPQWHWPAFRGAVAFGWPLYLNNILAFATERLGTLLVAFLLKSPELVGLFEMGKRLPGMGVRLLNSLLVPYLPGVSVRIAQRDFDGAARLLDKASNLMAFMSYSGVLVALIIQKPLIVFLFTSGYIDIEHFLWVLMVASCLAVQTGIMGQSIIALGRPGLVTAINIGTASLSLASGAALIPSWGLMGSACAYLVANVFSYGAQTWMAWRCGLRFSIVAILKPHLFVACALALFLATGSTPLSGLLASALFFALCAVGRVVTMAQLIDILRALGLLRGLRRADTAGK